MLRNMRIHHIAPVFWLLTLGTITLPAQPLVKGQVAEKIRRVEDSVDEFRDYLERRGESAKDRSSTAQSSGRTRKRGGGEANTEAKKETASQRKDELENALDDLNQSTNRLRRKFDATDTWMETKVQVEQVMDDGRRINQAVARGNYGSDVARLWALYGTSSTTLPGPITLLLWVFNAQGTKASWLQIMPGLPLERQSALVQSLC